MAYATMDKSNRKTKITTAKVFGAVKKQGWKDADIWEALKEGKFRHRKAFIEHKNGASGQAH